MSEFTHYRFLRLSTVRVSLVMLALLLPALFSSLLAVSSVGEGRSAKTIPLQVNTAEALASLVSEWEQGVYEVADDDIDDYTLLSRCTHSSELAAHQERNHSSSCLLTVSEGIFIRGPPFFA